MLIICIIMMLEPPEVDHVVLLIYFEQQHKTPVDMDSLKILQIVSAIFVPIDRILIIIDNLFDLFIENLYSYFVLLSQFLNYSSQFI